MLGKTLAAVVVAAFIAVVPTTAAYAAPSGGVVHTVVTPTPSPNPTDYTPTQHTVPSLDGTFVGTQCIGGVPYVGYSIVLNDPDNQVLTNQASLTMSGSGQTHTIQLGTLDANDRLSGVLLWPGASVDANGNGTGWPGWELVNGEWVETDGNFAWTRGAITAVISVNPDLTVPLSYPPETSGCADPPGSPGNPASLPATGSTFDPAPLLIVGGALVVLGGLAVLLVGRRAARRN